MTPEAFQKATDLDYEIKVLTSNLNSWKQATGFHVLELTVSGSGSYYTHVNKDLISFGDLKERTIQSLEHDIQKKQFEFNLL